MDDALTKVPYSDEWWFSRLFREFHASEPRPNGKNLSRSAWADHLWSWFEGNPPLPLHTEGWRGKASADVLRMGRANFAKLAVESKMDRVELAGFRVSVDDNDQKRQEQIDRAGRRIMKRYSSAFEDAMLYASVMKDGYLWVGEPQADGLPLITAEKPQNCVTIDSPIDPSIALAAMKLYRDNLTNEEVAHVVLPADDDVIAAGGHIDRGDDTEKRPVRVVIMRRPSSRSYLTRGFNAQAWIAEDAKPLPPAAQGRGIPVYHVRAPHGLGDFEPHLDLLARINNMIVDRLWITKLQVFRQRALRDTVDPEDHRGPDERMPENDPKTGEKIDYSKVFEADPGSLWELPYGYDIWESTPADLQPILLSVRDDVKEFATSTRTPLYVFMPDAIQGSAEGAEVAREGQVFKANSWKKRQTRTFLLVAQAALAIAGENLTEEDELDLVWTPSQTYSLSQRTQAARDAKEVGIPLQGIVEDILQLSPETWLRYKKQRQTDALRGLYALPTTGGAREATPAQPAPARPAAADPVEELSRNLDRPRQPAPTPAPGPPARR
ncbi:MULTISPECIES: hypothetical protein [unclassified Aeromicrobium]|uniref:hypothetical protein n=1 Tax=unclassified Aeromicrobium TaxID=2633570 RepID=UPI00288C1700|nr:MULTISPECIES: hypothetical protein [unclassified Aeromicrobium]